jgi:glutamate carboxypeptidase
MNLEGVRTVGRMFEAPLRELGFNTRWIDGAEWRRAGHLVAERRGKDSRALRVLLIGHLDTVFEPDSPFQRFVRLDDSTARGPGAVDMKGGNAIMLLALQALAGRKLLDRLHVTVFLCGDEEKNGEPLALARRDLIAAAEKCDVAIGFEDGAGDPRTAVIARRGFTGWRLEVHARPAHSSQIFRDDVGHGAIFEAARILSAFRDSLAGERWLTFNPGAIVGGTAVTWDSEAARGTAFGKNNVVAESTVVSGDLRAASIEQRDRAKQRMRAIVERVTPHARARIEFEDGYPPMALTDANRRLLAEYDRASRDLGLGAVEAVDPSRAGAADVSFAASPTRAALDGVGMRGSGGHTVEETADLNSLPRQAKRMALMLARLSRARQRP